MKTVDFSGRPFHFIGIGGIGMSALAYVLAKRQIRVSGSDLRSSHITERLEAVGTHIFSRQEPTNLEFFQPLDGICTDPLPQVICSTAIAQNNSEYTAAVEKGCPVFHRSDVLAALIKDYKSIGVAGTHGKTTTSSLIGYVLLVGGLDPTIIVGGEVTAWDGNARLGNGDYLVAEADESDGSLTKHWPNIGVVTNIELDHPDHYESLEDVVKIFQVFESQCDILVGCLDCERISTQLNPTITYSLDPAKQADYTVKNITYDVNGTTADVWEWGQYLGQMHLTIPGEHNVSNALAAIAVGRKLGLEFDVIAQGLESFEGAKRRFEFRGECNGITFIDDYAHHPSEIQATLSAARSKLGSESSSRVVAIFQPHRYTRTMTFLEDFATSFKAADLVILTDIYSAGEANISHLQGQDVAEAVKQHHSQVIYEPDLSSLTQLLPEILQSGDLVLFLGAGNLNQIIPQVIASYDPS
ncbi:UDP-N-acetylmuramate--L-alanine ligase [Aphanothece sacrum]|uniref:UDP-N-acetylmuramate--L-alanine ligase n=1 Tax=Aphanothece sacrum FPU1 TaxID=1920663 RepID=A0A401INP8_APHSA|nr:UDP-N-acetylmuramate--L-alanine ligase [Aphanothece sacrum]GBF82895.1 UDP-N-acetylmuramate--L-alanine ligase [Aphanothece sacrum FPU1]GBF85971.1 UDP-N-acetylmuramate--L-alanine ligase [Aphanothece sacrum FPU3]